MEVSAEIRYIDKHIISINIIVSEDKLNQTIQTIEIAPNVFVDVNRQNDVIMIEFLDTDWLTYDTLRWIKSRYCINIDVKKIIDTINRHIKKLGLVKEYKMP